MISTTTKAAEFTSAFGGLGTALKQNIRHLPVKLTAGGFTGSGAILATNAASSSFFVATAKHNLTMAPLGVGGHGLSTTGTGADKEIVLTGLHTGKLITWIKANLKVSYFTAESTGGAISTSGGTANGVEVGVADVIFIEGTPSATTWAYDACLLKVSYSGKTAPLCPGRLWHERGAWLKRTTDKLADINGGEDLSGNHKLAQVGFGRREKPATGSNGERREKISEFLLTHGTHPGAASYYSESTGTNTNVLLLKSTEDWTTLPGDSGGPLYIFDPNFKVPVQLAVTLGADCFATQEEEAQHAGDADGTHNNTATSLLPIYEWMLKQQTTEGSTLTL